MFLSSNSAEKLLANDLTAALEAEYAAAIPKPFSFKAVEVNTMDAPLFKNGNAR